LSEFATIQEIVLKAHREMRPQLWDYVSGGSESETTLRRNRQAIDRIAFRPRVLRDVSEIDPSVSFLGRKLRIPVFLAPIGEMQQVHPEGAMPCLTAAREFGLPFFLSSINSVSLEAAAQAAGEILFFQLYVRGDEAWVDACLKRVADVQCKGFCLTVDTAYYSRRERDLISGYAPPGRRGKPREGFQYQSAITWDFVDRVRKKLRVPMILKGISTAEDARLAIDHGVDVIYVSNHGGRQLDHGRGMIDVLPEVVEAAGGKAEVVVDGGFVRGTDILKAIALGAHAVGLGKLQAYALAAAGETGLKRMFEILEEEIRVTMGLLGVTRMDQLDRTCLQADMPVKFPSEFSPFPTLEKVLTKGA
jgi:isopentenyl diphosphate isomerase/L-lactate dehydrogenase-like FMN-dependent dehydrogenase